MLLGLQSLHFLKIRILRMTWLALEVRVATFWLSDV